MNAMRKDRAVSDEPWAIILKKRTGNANKPKMMRPPAYSRDNPLWVGGEQWWIEDHDSEQCVFLNSMRVYESEYPDEIWDEIQARESEYRAALEEDRRTNA